MPKHTIVENTLYSVVGEQVIIPVEEPKGQILFTNSQAETLYELFNMGFGYVDCQFDADDKNILMLIEKGLVTKRYVVSSHDDVPSTGDLAFCMTALGYAVALGLFSSEQLPE